MGKEYSNANYKKTYGENYVKSYGDRRIMKRVYNEGVKSYKEITQKLSSYNKDEKGKYDGLQVDSTSVIDVLDKTNEPPKAQNTSRTKRVTTTQFDTNTNDVQEKNTQAQNTISEYNKTTTNISQSRTKETSSSAQSVVDTPPKTITPPPYAPSSENKKTKKKASRDYEFYRNMVTPPVVPIGNGMYREMNKKEVVDEREARKILSYADYSPKEQLNLIIFYIIALIGGFAFSLVGPIAIIAWGVLTKGKHTTMYEKKLQMGSLSVTMPATEQEKANYQKRGQLYINVAIVIGVIQFIRLVYF